MQEAGVAKPAGTEWTSPVEFVLKEDESLCFCVHYRRLDNATVRDSYPTLHMNLCIDLLGEAQIFSTLDANLRYWQIDMDDHVFLFQKKNSLLLEARDHP